MGPFEFEWFEWLAAGLLLVAVAAFVLALLYTYVVEEPLNRSPKQRDSAAGDGADSPTASAASA